MSAPAREAAPPDRELLAAAAQALRVEAEAVAALADRLDGAFVEACRLVAATPGRVLVAGLGKSGLVARKLAATLTATGTPAHFLHPVDALHGDLGAAGPEDLAIVLSRSGQAPELVELVEHLGRLGVPTVAVLGSPGPLAERARVCVPCPVEREACPHDLTPTASSTAMLALGDAMALAVMRLKGFGAKDFAERHPGGALGRKLTLRVADVMVSEGYPWLPESATMRDTIAPLARMRGTVPILDEQHRLAGVVTAGDLTRLMERDPEGFLGRRVAEVMTRDAKTARPDELGSAAADRLRAHGVMALPVVDAGGRVRGIVHLHDLMRAGAV
ncbi:MAG TPA: KpsF/GutQ family sugar-phosphate isomerase [Longimicrobiales bacterium]|nr:KpsF/GutQ family sugar-phosphate isomerase [Longimicrobiales bacterium]